MKRIGYLLIITTLIMASISCKNTKTEAQNRKLTYLALGDSYTIGESVEENKRFPVQLKDTLKKYGIIIHDLKIIAKTGWTTDELATGIQNENNLREKYDLVTLLIGVNNQYRGRDAENYRKEFKELLDQAITFAGGNKKRVYVISIPDWGVTPFAEGRDRKKIADEIDLYNRINFEEASKAGVKYTDITPVTRKAADDDKLIAEDGLHPSGYMYSLWVEKLSELIKKDL